MSPLAFDIAALMVMAGLGAAFGGITGMGVILAVFGLLCLVGQAMD